MGQIQVGFGQLASPSIIQETQKAKESRRDSAGFGVRRPRFKPKICCLPDVVP